MFSRKIIVRNEKKEEKWNPTGATRHGCRRGRRSGRMVSHRALWWCGSGYRQGDIAQVFRNHVLRLTAPRYSAVVVTQTVEGKSELAVGNVSASNLPFDLGDRPSDRTIGELETRHDPFSDYGTTCHFSS